METPEQKKHRPKVAGTKAERKKKKLSTDEQSARQRNPKAFALQSAVKAAKKFHRSQDVKLKKIHIPLPDRTALEPAPIVIGIVGPPKVGKTTLLHCIVRNYTKQKLTNVQGPVTLVAGKKRRLTLIEVDNDLGNMIDIAKVADLVILMVDASFGFEMEVFEFLNICNVHGFPRIMGVLNHLDTFKDSKKLRKTKKRLKDRFWTEIYQGAKLFYLSGMVEDEYQKMEIHNLCRFISVMKFRPLTWQTSHPYMLADRMEDITNPELIEKDPKCDRRVTLYGYSRGIALKKQQAIHIPGVGDFRAAEIESLPDPCPTPEMDKKRRTLNQKERLVYAPMSGVGGVLYDKDAVYIDIGGSHHMKQDNPEESTPIKELIASLVQPTNAEDSEDGSDFEEDQIITQSLFETGDGRVRRKAIFPGETFTTPDDDKDEDDEDDDAEDGQSSDEGFSEDKNRAVKVRQEVDDQDVDDDEEGEEEDTMEGDSSDEDDDDDDGEEDDKEDGENSEDEQKWAKYASSRSLEEFHKRKERNKDWHKIIYGDDDGADDEEEGDDRDELGGLFKVLKKKANEGKAQKYSANSLDCSRFPVEASRDWNCDEVCQLIKDCFVTGKWDASTDASSRLQQDDDLFGDFEDLETGEKVSGKAGADVDDDDSDNDDDDDDEKEGEGKEESAPQRKKRKAEMTKQERRQEIAEKKKRKKEEFDAMYDIKTDGDDDFYQSWKAQLEEQAKLNRAEFENLPDDVRVNLEGFRPGLYLRVEVEGVPCEFIKHFDPRRPLIIGGLSHQEENVGFIRAKLTKHRFYGKILKTRNPLIISLGWRRFQTLPIYSHQDDNMRQRFLKYTPGFKSCMATFWGPITPQLSGLLAMETISEVSRGFRVAATGVVLELDKKFEIVKKLKLVGTPHKIFKKTAYIQGMFNSELEVAKFEGCKVQTVSKIRGIVKRAARRLDDTHSMLPAGTFRATFEDKINMSDIVFLRTWLAVEVPEFYNPVTNLLGEWQAMKTVGQLRYERGVSAPLKGDSLYKPVERKPRRTAPLIIPRGLQRELPFKLTPKSQAQVAAQTKRIPVVLEPQEAKKLKFMKMMKVIHEHQMRTKHAVMRQRAHAHQKKQAREAAKDESKSKDIKKDLYRMMGKMQRAKEAKERGRRKQSHR